MKMTLLRWVIAINLMLPIAHAQSVTGSGTFDFLIILTITIGGFIALAKIISMLK